MKNPARRGGGEAEYRSNAGSSPASLTVSLRCRLQHFRFQGLLSARFYTSTPNSDDGAKVRIAEEFLLIH
jgi:hypothetical protein